MNVPFLAQCLIVAVVLRYPDNVTGQLTAAPPTCRGDTFTFKCTVTGNMSEFTIWRVNGGSECPLPHRTNGSSICGPDNAFTARGFETSASLLASTLSGTATSALDGTLVECFGPDNSVDPGNMVGSSTLQMPGPPSVSILSCVDLFGDVSGAVNVTVSWTLSDGDSADFYLINITTNAPQTQYGGLLNISAANVTQCELTGFIQGYEYSITVRGVNCGIQEGGESEPLMISPQVPAVPSSCNITLSYNQSTERLQWITSSWNSILNPDDPSEACPGPNGNITQYQISFWTGSVTSIENVNITRCTAGRCSHTFEPTSNSPSSYDNVSVAAKNVVGVGPARLCTTQTISTTNNLLTGQVVDATSPNNATVICTFLSGFTGSAHCRVQYGTDPTYMNLPYSAESTETGTAGDTVSVVMKERMNSSTAYYYTLSAVSGDVTIVLQGTFTTLQYSCSLMDFGGLSAINATFLNDTGLLDDATRYPSCVTENFRSVVLKDTALNIAIVVYYNGTTPGSRACFICDGRELNTTINERVCQTDATWSESPVTCVPKPCTQQQSLIEWHITLIVIGVLALVVSVVIIIIIVVVSCQRMGGGDGSRSSAQKDEMKWWHIIVMVIAVIFCLIGVVLWITVGAVVSNLPDNDVCDPGWCHSCDALIILGFVFSLLPILLVPTVPLIYPPLKKQVLACCKKWDVKSKPKNRTQPGRSDEMQLQENDIEVAVPGYDIIQHDQAQPRAVLTPSEPSYSHITEVSTRLRYAELGPHIPLAAVAPPPIDNNVRYTSLLHDQNQSELNGHIPEGSLPASDDATSNSQSPLGSPPPIPPQQFSNEDILLLPKLSESMELQEDGRDTPPPLPPKINEEDMDLPPLPSKINEEDMALPPLPSKINEEDMDLPPLPPKINEEDMDLPPLPSKINEEDMDLPPLPSKINKEDMDLPPLPSKINKDMHLPPLPSKRSTEHTDIPPLPPKTKQRDTVLLSCSPKTNQEGVILPHLPSQVNQEDTTLPPLPPKRERADTALYSCPPKANHEDALLPPLPPKVVQENAAPPPLPPKETKKTLHSNHATPR